MDEGRGHDSGGPDSECGQCDGGGERDARDAVPVAGERGGNEHQPDGQRRGTAVGAAGAQWEHSDGVSVGGWDDVDADQQRHGAAAGARVRGARSDEPYRIDGRDRVVQQRRRDG